MSLGDTGGVFVAFDGKSCVICWLAIFPCVGRCSSLAGAAIAKACQDEDTDVQARWVPRAPRIQ